MKLDLAIENAPTNVATPTIPTQPTTPQTAPMETSESADFVDDLIKELSELPPPPPSVYTNPISRLYERCQQFVGFALPEFTFTPSAPFVATCHFRGKTFTSHPHYSKKEAKEDCARRILNDTSINWSPTSQSISTPSPAFSGGIAKQYRSILMEYTQLRAIPKPVYESFATEAGFRARVTVAGQMFELPASVGLKRKKDAEEHVAKIAVDSLTASRRPTLMNITPSSLVPANITVASRPLTPVSASPTPPPTKRTADPDTIFRDIVKHFKPTDIQEKEIKQFTDILCAELQSQISIASLIKTGSYGRNTSLSTTFDCDFVVLLNQDSDVRLENIRNVVNNLTKKYPQFAITFPETLRDQTLAIGFSFYIKSRKFDILIGFQSSNNALEQSRYVTQQILEELTAADIAQLANGSEKSPVVRKWSTSLAKPCVEFLCKRSGDANTFVRMVKLWASLVVFQPSNMSWRFGNYCIELLACYAYDQAKNDLGEYTSLSTHQEPSLMELFVSFLKLLSNPSKITVLFEEFYRRNEIPQTIMRNLEPPYIMDPSCYFNILKSNIPWDALSQAAKLTLNKLAPLSNFRQQCDWETMQNTVFTPILIGERLKLGTLTHRIDIIRPNDESSDTLPYKKRLVNDTAQTVRGLQKSGLMTAMINHLHLWILVQLRSHSETYMIASDCEVVKIGLGSVLNGLVAKVVDGGVEGVGKVTLTPVFEIGLPVCAGYGVKVTILSSA